MKPATVAGPSGLPIAAARTTATSEERHTTRTAQTGTGGLYVHPPLPVGTCTLHIEFEGFKAFDRHGVALNANQNARIDAGVVGNSVLSGDRPRARKIVAWFDRNAGRNALIGAPAATSNLGAFKSFALRLLY